MNTTITQITTENAAGEKWFVGTTSFKESKRTVLAGNSFANREIAIFETEEIAAQVVKDHNNALELRNELIRETDRAALFERMLDKADLRNEHQIENDGGPKEIKEERDGFVLEMQIENHPTAGLETSVAAYIPGRTSSIIVRWSDSEWFMLEAAEQAEKILKSERYLLREELSRNDIAKVLRDKLEWACDQIKMREAA